MAEETKKKIEIPAKITVKEFAQALKMPVTEVIALLMKNGILASQNENIDFETAAILADDLGFQAEQKKEEEELKGEDLKEILGKEDKKKLKPRPPVVVVLGHVDHGKTMLLDAIRRTKVMEEEHGGITQHIGAYQVKEKKQLISFIDTPGHEAFTAMRSRGAKVADIAILVIAADDSIKPQTKEALDIIKAAQIPFIVAINKIDKPDADVNKVLKDLANLDLLPEEWGGKTICVQVSAKEKRGIDELLEMILLVYDLEKEKIKANPEGKAVASVVESHIDRGEGAVATVLIQAGTLKVGDLVTISEVYGKIKAMKDFKGETLSEAAPSTPVKILGLKGLPVVGDILTVTDEIKKIKKRTKQYRIDKHLIKPSEIRIETKKEKEEKEKEERKRGKKDREEKIKTLKLILKADSLGSLEAITESLKKFKHEEIKLEIVHSGLGNITENDILKAEASGALLRGFNVSLSKAADDLAKEKNITFKIYNVIYELLEEIKNELETLISPELLEKKIGRLKVIAIFRTEKKSMIVGGKVTDGKIIPRVKAKVLRDKKEISRGKISQVQIEKKVTSEATKGQECGLKYEGEPVVQEGDLLEVFEEDKVFKKIEV